MNRNSSGFLWLGFFVLAALALGVSWFAFELRYMWYVDADQFMFLRVGSLICTGLMIASWVAYPSRLFVALVGLTLLLFPPLLRGAEYASMDIGFIGWICVSVMLLLVATELEVRARRAGRKSVG